uniref:Uncharacterized protein n=1 Tax=Candidatus Kentrum sp. TC TaxID=2126339 RepID=A0A450Z0Q9_9GAMM|nr:MAG: hypothetical protein BECKTC1821E_GA0114239_108314 [Candidatus Kentron sp. TC]
MVVGADGSGMYRMKAYRLTKPMRLTQQWVRQWSCHRLPVAARGVDSPYLPTRPFRASGDSARSTPFGELCVLTYAGRG